MGRFACAKRPIRRARGGPVSLSEGFEIENESRVGFGDIPDPSYADAFFFFGVSFGEESDVVARSYPFGLPLFSRLFPPDVHVFPVPEGMEFVGVRGQENHYVQVVSPFFRLR